MDHVRKFRASPQHKAWTDISASETFEAATTAAMMMMVHGKTVNADEIVGAKTFLANLQSLGEPSPKLREPIASANLDHSV